VQSERGRKHAEAELAELSVRVNELSVTITNLSNDKRRLEGDLANLQAELEEALLARRAAEDRADRAQVEINRLVEELRQVCILSSVVVVQSADETGANRGLPDSCNSKE